MNVDWAPLKKASRTLAREQLNLARAILKADAHLSTDDLWNIAQARIPARLAFDLPLVPEALMPQFMQALQIAAVERLRKFFDPKAG